LQRPFRPGYGVDNWNRDLESPTIWKKTRCITLCTCPPRCEMCRMVQKWHFGLWLHISTFCFQMWYGNRSGRT